MGRLETETAIFKEIDLAKYIEDTVWSLPESVFKLGEVNMVLSNMIRELNAGRNILFAKNGDTNTPHGKDTSVYDIFTIPVPMACAVNTPDGVGIIIKGDIGNNIFLLYINGEIRYVNGKNKKNIVGITNNYADIIGNIKDIGTVLSNMKSALNNLEMKSEEKIVINLDYYKEHGIPVLINGNLYTYESELPIEDNLTIFQKASVWFNKQKLLGLVKTR